MHFMLSIIKNQQGFNLIWQTMNVQVFVAIRLILIATLSVNLSAAFQNEMFTRGGKCIFFLHRTSQEIIKVPLKFQ